MAKHKQQPLRVLGVEMQAIGHPAVTALSAGGLAAVGVPSSLIESWAGELAGRPDRFVVDLPVAVEILSTLGEPWVGSLRAAVTLERGDVDRLMAGLRAAGWSAQL